MEDAATAEIHAARSGSGAPTASCLETARRVSPNGRRVDDRGGVEARSEDGRRRPALGRRPGVYAEMALSEEYADFLTLPAYERMP